MTFEDLMKLAVKMRDKYGPSKTRAVIQKYAKKLNDVAPADYEKLAADLNAMTPARSTSLPHSIRAPYGGVPEFDTTSQQVESLTPKPTMLHRVVNSREEAIATVKELQEKWDLIDDNTVLRQLMEKMEERHGEEFNAFFAATIRQIMIGSGMTELRIDTNAVLLTLAQSAPLRVREAPGYLIYELVEDVDA